MTRRLEAAIVQALLLLLDHQPPQFKPSLTRHNRVRDELRQAAYEEYGSEVAPK